MMFVDRLFLSWYSPDALNAGANASLAYYMILVIPMGICAISEVLVGRLHGDERLRDTGGAAWQMVWLAVLLAPLFLLCAMWLPNVLFYQSGNLVYETEYFSSLLPFASFLCASTALNGFFTSVGKVRVVTYCAILANLVNIVADYVLIFGWEPIPAYGVAGAALATGLAQVAQVILLLCFFLSKKNQGAYGTRAFGFNRGYFAEGLRIGAPAGCGHAIEMMAHYLVFRMIMLVGQEQMTVVAVVQSCYILFWFVIEAQSKGIGAIVANLLGAGKKELVPRVLRSSMTLHTLFFLILALLFSCAPNFFLRLFLPDSGLLLSASSLFHVALFWMVLFFLFDGFSWIMAGILTAAGDTKFILYVSMLLNWVGYVLPILLFVGWAKNGADIAWTITTAYGAMHFGLYFLRYRSGKWLRHTPTELAVPS